VAGLSRALCLLVPLACLACGSEQGSRAKSGGGGSDATPSGGDDAGTAGGGEDAAAEDAGGGPDGAVDAGATDDVAPVPFDPCPPLDLPPGPVTELTAADAPRLAQLVAEAAPGATLSLAPGTYPVDGALWIRTEGLTLRGATGSAAEVVLDADYAGGSVVTVAASRVTLAHLTLRRAYFHGVHVRPNGPESGPVEGVRIYAVHVDNPREQGIKVNQEATVYVDDGLVACSTISLDAAGRARVENNCYTGGIDIHRSRGWHIRDNHIEGFWCEQGLAEHGVHMWRMNAHTLIERNRIVNCGRGIGLGMAQSGGDNQRLHPDVECPAGAYADDFAGTVRNNLIIGDDPALFASGSGFDNGISLWSACQAKVLHNTIWSTQPPFSAIEWRFPGTTALIRNNLVSHNLRDRGVTSADLAGNLEGAPKSLFADAARRDLHLAPGAIAAIDRGVALAPGEADEDFEGDPRDAQPDIGADER